jgi:hypothetical protein
MCGVPGQTCGNINDQLLVTPSCCICFVVVFKHCLLSSRVQATRQTSVAITCLGNLATVCRDTREELAQCNTESSFHSLDLDADMRTNNALPLCVSAVQVD